MQRNIKTVCKTSFLKTHTKVLPLVPLFPLFHGVWSSALKSSAKYSVTNNSSFSLKLKILFVLKQRSLKMKVQPTKGFILDFFK